MEPFAAPVDVTEFGGTATDQTDALCRYASVLVRADFPDVDARIASGQLDAELVKFVAVSMVTRAQASPDDGATQVQSQETIGPWQHGGGSTFANGRGLYISKREARMLRRGGSAAGAFTINPVAIGAGGELPWWDRE